MLCDEQKWENKNIIIPLKIFNKITDTYLRRPVLKSRKR